jgi:hypothetical protein
MLCALKVEGWLAVFHPAMKLKAEMQRKYRSLSRVKEQLIASGYAPEIAELAISNQTPFQAACAWVATSGRAHRAPETIANYSRRYRKHLWRCVSDPEAQPPAPQQAAVVRFVIDLTDKIPLPLLSTVHFKSR